MANSTDFSINSIPIIPCIVHRVSAACDRTFGNLVIFQKHMQYSQKLTDLIFDGRCVATMQTTEPTHHKWGYREKWSAEKR